MSNSIEQIITEIEDYIEDCKFSPLSSTKILINKEELMELLDELKSKTPAEIKKYQRMLANKNSILEDAKQKAQNILAEAEEQADAMVNAHEITQQAYIQGNEYINQANEQAKRIIEEANQEGDMIRLNAIKYTDDLLASIQNTVTYSMENITMRYEAYIKSLQKTLELIVANRNELNIPATPVTKTQMSQQTMQGEVAGTVDLPNELTDEDYTDYTLEMDDFEEE